MAIIPNVLAVKSIELSVFDEILTCFKIKTSD